VARNSEIKARVTDVAGLNASAGRLADEGPTMIHQDDTFFACDHGRLKLRAFADGRGELIFYQRADATGPKPSFYEIAPTHDAGRLRDTLAAALGQVGRVIKTRTLYRVGRTRIHIDRVDRLGDFMELEVVLHDDEPAAAGMHEAHELMTALGIPESALVERAYVDLLDDARP
jgi:adenylate cyclase class IV